MKLIVKNSSSESCSYASGKVVILAGSELDINYLHWFSLLLDLTFIRDLRNNNLVVNDGLKDMVYPESESYLVTLNQLNIANRDTDGSQIQRSKAAKAGWKAQFHAIRISTATTNGVRNKKRDGTDLGFCTYTMYDAENQVTTEAAQCVKTVVTWEPTHDIEIVGGQLFQGSVPADDVYMYVTAAAHIPQELGGSIAFLEGGINLKDVSIGVPVDFDGRVSKYMAYDTTYHSSRFLIELQHAANFQHSFTLVFELFRP